MWPSAPGRRQLSVYAGEPISAAGAGGAQEALERLIAGEGLTMAVQPIVSIPTGTTHAYEALARFQPRGTSNPLHWFALADEFGRARRARAGLPASRRWRCCGAARRAPA